LIRGRCSRSHHMDDMEMYHTYTIYSAVLAVRRRPRMKPGVRQASKKVIGYAFKERSKSWTLGYYPIDHTYNRNANPLRN
jgi:hypothetical protein